MLKLVTERNKKEKIKQYTKDLNILRSMLADAETHGGASGKNVVKRYRIDYEYIIELDAIDILFYITRVEEFYNKDFYTLSEEEQQKILSKVLTSEVMQKASVHYLGWLFSLYADYMTDKQLEDLSAVWMRKAHDNFVVYRVLATKLFELGKDSILQTVLLTIEEKFGSNASKEIKENLTK